MTTLQRILQLGGCLLVCSSYVCAFTNPRRALLPNKHHQIVLGASQEKEITRDTTYYSPSKGGSATPNTGSLPAVEQRITLTRFLNSKVKKNPELRDLEFLLSIQMACKTISNLVNRCGLVYASGSDDYGLKQYPPEDGRFYSMKRLDQLSTNVLKNALRFTGKCEVVTPAPQSDAETPAQHQPGVLVASAYDSKFVAILDPLDGSGNADAAICTGTIFGVFENKNEDGEGEDGAGSDDGVDNVVIGGSDSSPDVLLDTVLQKASNMRAAGYCLYSSATVLVFTLGEGCVYGFTLDPQTKEFVLTHNNLTIPQRGNVYSCNEANSEGWADDIRDYLKALKTGDNQTKRRYAHRYVGSMVGDIHRTLLYGGIFMYPSDTEDHPQGNLQLLYKSAPIAFVVSQAGGKSVDETGTNLLDIQPERVHQKSPCFIGSSDDVDELQQYLNKLKEKVGDKEE
mmetsp:Transcript_8831/g.12517  ORF Transcript_8831/g.12517 Transcript_8831/m.12517 type:complete len:455 (+) Transcript_8831:181-1545(+)